MTKKEKKAIEHLKIVAKERIILPLDDEIGVVLNLIEKQSKEIEELKDKIKVKIEEIDNMELCSMRIPKLSTLDERLGAKIGIKYVLQSLLEKE